MTSIEAKAGRNEEVEMLSHVKLFAAALLAAITAALAFPPSTEAGPCTAPIDSRPQAASTTPAGAPCETIGTAR